MIKVLNVYRQCQALQALVGVDLAERLAQLPQAEDLPLAPSLIVLVPLGGAYGSLGLDAQAGPYVAKRHTRTFAAALRRQIGPPAEAVTAAEQAVFAALGMRQRFKQPPPVIPYLNQFYLVLGSAAHRDPVLIAGHYLKAIKVVGPGRFELRITLPGKQWCVLELSGPQRLDAAKLSLLAAYAAAVTLRLQPLAKTYGRALAGTLFGEPVPAGNYAQLQARVSAQGVQFTEARHVTAQAVAAKLPAIMALISARTAHFDPFLFREDLLALFKEDDP